MAPAGRLIFQAIKNYTDFRQFCASEVDGSMSNPLTAGAATVVRDFYNKAK